jgi:hypothetical protein
MPHKDEPIWICPKCGDATSWDTWQERMQGHWIEAYERHEEFCDGRPERFRVVSDAA